MGKKAVSDSGRQGMPAGVPVKRFWQRIGNPIDWSYAGKGALITGGSLAFGIINIFVVLQFRSHPERAEHFNRNAGTPLLAWCIFVAVCYSILFLWGLRERKHNPGSRVYMRAVIHFWWTATAAYAYWVGPFENASVGQLVLAGGIFGFLFFDHRIVLEGIGTFLALVLLTIPIESLGWLPHAPMLAADTGTGTTVGDSRLPALPGLFLLFAAVMIGAFYYTVAKWRERETQLAIAHEELKKAHEELQNTQQQLVRAESLAAVGSLVTGASHELRNPLGSSSGLLQSLRDEITAAADITDARKKDALQTLDMALKGQRRAVAIVERLYRLTDDLSSKGSTYKLTRLIEDLLERYPDVTIQKHGIAPDLRVSERVLTTILTNLIENALASESTTPPVLEIHAENGFLVFSVTDQGRGIPPEHHTQVFKPFFTLGKTAPGKNVGLGLYIVHELASRGGGDVTLESKPGQGTKITVRLPAPHA